jgi:hypothetical protein
MGESKYWERNLSQFHSVHTNPTDWPRDGKKHTGEKFYKLQTTQFNYGRFKVRGPTNRI